MKKFATIGFFVISAVAITSCGDDNTKKGKIYMPDMAYSRAYETYTDHSNLAARGASFNNEPVAGTVARGEELPYHLKNDSTGYAQSAAVANPLARLNEADMVEAERLYLINCAICHGTKLDGNGPLYKDGNGPYAAKPANLVGDARVAALPEGTLYHVMTYGKNLMGSYASQLNRKQRWMVAQYIKSQQKPVAAAPAATDSTAKK